MKAIRTFLTVLVVSLVVYSCSNKEENDFNVHIQIIGAQSDQVYMQERANGEWIKIDSAKLTEYEANFTGSLDMPKIVYFTIPGSRNFIPVFIEAGSIKVIVDPKNMRNPEVIGSVSHLKYQEMITGLKLFDDKARDLSQHFREARTSDDIQRMEEISLEYEQLESDKSASILNFAMENNTSVVAPFTILNYSYMFELSDLEWVYETLTPDIAASSYASSLNDRIKTLKRVEIGQPFVDFILNDPDGNPVALSSVATGNYVLVDFWASWCGPCRDENPNIVDAFEKYNEKGFDVFGVSLDRDHMKWVEAIEKDGLNWTQVSDLKYWNSKAGKLYGVQSIPHSVLLDPNGIIIAKNLRGNNLQKKLAELLN